MPDCGSQVLLCGLPIRFDTYKGCSHGCKYCFASRKYNINDIRIGETRKALLNFISGARTRETYWCDWDIPLHWGGVSDPFQPIEKQRRNSLDCLKVFAESQYPFVVSTKGKVIVDDEYLSLIKECNCVIQISAVCEEYDELEPGAPKFGERLKMIEKLSSTGKRVNVRVQPYLISVHRQVLESIRKFKDCGAHGILIEGMKFAKKKSGLIKVGADWVYRYTDLKQRFKHIKSVCRDNGIKFYCAENRLRELGDSFTCCGVDGLQGFKANEYNLCNIVKGVKATPTARMNESGSGYWSKTLTQTSKWEKIAQKISCVDYFKYYLNAKNKLVEEMFSPKCTELNAGKDSAN